MNKTVTFAQLEHILTELGFVKNVVPKTGVAYEHPPTQTLFVVRLHKPDEIVPGKVLLAAQLQLDGRGVIEAAEFEQMLRNVAA